MKTTFSQFLYELDASKVDPKLFFHKNLNPKLWDEDDNLHPAVKKALLRIAEKFKSFLDLSRIKVTDIIFTGSNCNYNYSKYSDIDLHLIVDISKFTDEDLMEHFLIAKKALWNSGHDIHIHGFPVELYAQIEGQPLIASGVYSLEQNKWLTKPSYTRVTPDLFSVKNKSADLMTQIDDIIDSKTTDTNFIEQLKEKIRDMRKAGLETGGEHSVENLTYKSLRNNGYLDKLSNYLTTVEDQDLSLE